MGTTADKLTYLLETKQAIKEAISAKGVKVSDSESFRSYADKIFSISSGGAEMNDVNFRDYEGTILRSYTKDEFLALSTMPDLPTRKGLICQGWNWELAEAQAYVAKYGKLEIGAYYITDDGKTRLYISIALGRMDVPLHLRVGGEIIVDWGDDNTEVISQTGTIDLIHHYDRPGDYCIAIEGSISLEFDSPYCIMGKVGNYPYPYILKKVEAGAVYIGNYAFYNCKGLSEISVAKGCLGAIFRAFQQTSLKGFVFPKEDPYSEDPYSYLGTKAFAESGLQSVCFNSIIGYIDDGMFESCNLQRVTIPESVLELEGSTFASNSNLSEVILPDSLTYVRGNEFFNCYSLASVVIPRNITTIRQTTFKSCIGMAFYDFRTHEVVPTLENTNAFYSIPSDCKIVVPNALYEEWIVANNWSTYAHQIIKAKQYECILNNTPYFENGVYIQHIDGTLYSTNEWIASGNDSSLANGAALVTDDVEFVVRCAYPIAAYQWASDTSNLIDGVMATTDAEIAKTDYNGARNTELINDTSGAAYQCAKYIFPNGAKGYLPSLGELDAAKNNKTALIEAMELIGSDGFNGISGYLWSSTQRDATTAWMHHWGKSNIEYDIKSSKNAHSVAVFAKLTK